MTMKWKLGVRLLPVKESQTFDVLGCSGFELDAGLVLLQEE